MLAKRSDNNLPNCNEIIESSLIYRKGVSPSGVNDVLTPKDSRISPKIACMVAKRSEWRFTLHERENKSEALAIK